MKKLQIQNQIEECQKTGLNAFHFPIKDNTPPSNQQEFKKLVAQVVQNSLKTGKNVVVHCKGGIGRAPTFATACLIYSGLNLEDALKIIKLARKDCELTDSQHKFLKGISFNKSISINKNTIRTSETHPICIDFLNFKWKEAPSKLGITFAPGKKQKDAWTGIWERNLDKDLERIKNHYQMNTLVSLMEEDEMKVLQIQDLLEKSEKNNLKTVSFPIKENKTPHNQEQFKKIAIQVVDANLKNGKNVVIICKGGLCRSALLATACLIYSGLSIQQAINIVKSSRKNSSFTNRQIDFLSKLSFK